MKTIGWLLLAIGFTSIFVGCVMDTTVSTSLGGGRVHNLGLLRDQQNAVLIGCLLALIGTIVLLFTRTPKVDTRSGLSILPHATESDLLPCPFCAEPIRKAAIICRHCGNTLNNNQSVEDKDQVVHSTEIEEELVKLGVHINNGKYSVGIYEFSSAEDAIAAAKKFRSQ